jgi:hypothetical protein
VASLSGVRASTDCAAVYQHLYPGNLACDRTMVCSSNFACYFDNDSCAEYKCMFKDSCPPGTTYTTFLPSVKESGQHATSGAQGFYCKPDTIPDDASLKCAFNANDNYKLTVEISVPGIQKQPQHVNDDRQITWLSQTNYEANKNPNNKAPVTFFQESSCVGTVTGGNVQFTVQMGDANCGMTLANETDEAGVLWYTQSFVVGYDDYVEDSPWGEVIKRYGMHYNMQCRISASDTLWVEPGADGDRNEQDMIDETEVEFDLKMYSNDQFTDEIVNGEEGFVDIGVDSQASQVIYVQAESQLPNDMDFVVHLKQCRINTYKVDETTGITEQLDEPVIMMVDGCLSGYDDTFINDNFAQNGSRVEWSNALVKTIDRDQYRVDLWEIPSLEANTKAIYDFECDIVLCEIAGFRSGSEVCKLNTQCENRYDNLNRFARPVQKDGKATRTNVFKQKFGLNVNFVEGTKPISPGTGEFPDYPGTSSATNTLCSFVLLAALSILF